MANWYTTEYTFTGDRAELSKLYDFMKGVETQHVDEYGTWFSYLLEAMGENPGDIFCRGYWMNLNFDGSTLTFNTQTAHQLVHQITHLLTQRFPGTEYFYFTDACDYQTNDKEGRFYPQRFVLDYDYDDYFNDEKSLLVRIKELMGQTFDSVDAAKKYFEEQEDCYLGIYEVGVIDTCDAMTCYSELSGKERFEMKGRLVRPDGSVAEEFTVTLGNK